MSRLLYLDSVRGIAILLILWLHLGARTSLVPAILEPTIRISSFALPLFFILSGYLYAPSLARQNTPTKKIILGKFKSTLVPFYALSLLFTPLVFINQQLTPGVSKTWQGSLKALFTFDISENLPSGVLWFLFVLFIFFIFTLAVTRLVKNIRLAKLALWVLSITLLLLYPWLADIHFMGLSRISRAFLFFIFGCYALNYFLLQKETTYRLLMLWLCAAAIFCIHFYLLQPGTYAYFIFEMLTCILANIAIILSCKFLMPRLTRIMEFFSFFGLHSMSIFVFHMPVYTLCAAIFRKTGLYTYMWTDIVIIALCALVPLLIEYALSYLPTLHRLLLGRKPLFQTVKNSTQF